MEITEQFSRRKPVKAQIEGLVSLHVHGTVTSVLFLCKSTRGCLLGADAGHASNCIYILVIT